MCTTILGYTPPAPTKKYNTELCRCDHGRVHCCTRIPCFLNSYCSPKLEQRPVSWRPTSVKCRQSSQSNRHSTVSTRQTERHEALPSSVNDEVRCDGTFADDGNASWYSVCRAPLVEWRLGCENRRHLTVVGLHDTGPRACGRPHDQILGLPLPG